jgi:hypothetical protein
MSGRLRLAQAAGFGSAGPEVVGAELARLAVREQLAPLLGSRLRKGALRATPDASRSWSAPTTSA